MRMFQHRTFFLSAVMLCLLSLSTTAVLGTSTVDQQQTAHNYYVAVTPGSRTAQTFTAGVTGTMDKVSLELTNVGQDAGSLVVEICSVDANGTPTATVLGGATVTYPSGTNGWQDIPLTTTVPVTSGTKYAIVLSETGTGNYHYINYTTATTYSGGQLFYGSNPASGSLAFKTWVNAGSGGGATETVDQEQLTSNYYVTTNPGSFQAQTFTAGITGSLSKVSFDFTNVGNDAGAIVAEIRSVDGNGAPTSSVLGTGTVTFPQGTNGWQDIPLTTPAAVTAGTRYALVFYETGSGNYYYANYNTSTVYASGQLFYNYGTWTSTSGSLKFKTWVIAASGGGGSDTTPPVTTASPSPSPNPTGWNTTNVNLTLSCTDNSSGCATTEYMEAQASGEAVDQQQQTSNYYVTSAATQTFTAGLSGSLSKVSLNFANVGAGAGNLVVEIRAVDGGGVPTATVLASVTKTFAANTSGWQDIQFTTPANVTAGTRYGLHFHQVGATGDYYYVSYSTNTTYNAGQLFYGTSPSSGSITFKTWVTPPTQSGTVDQQQLTSNYYVLTSPGSFNAQTFTPGMSGSLEKVSFEFTNVGVDAGSLALEIRSVDGNGVPTSTVLGTGGATFPQGTNGWQDVSLSSPLTVTAGTKYAIVISQSGTGNYHYVSYNTSTVYGGGELFFSNGVGSWQSVGGSLKFKTWMQGAAPTWLPYTGPILLSSNGTHVMMYRSMDQAGNMETAKTVTIRIDKSVPVLNLPPNITTSAVSPSGASVFYSASATFNGSPISVMCSPFSGNFFPVGATTVNCTANGSNGSTATGSFQVIVNGPSSNADLSSLSLSSGALTPLFNPAITAYNVTVGASTNSVSVLATKADPGSQLAAGLSTGGPIPIQSGVPSSPFSLNMGNNVLLVRVTAQSGATKFYSINVLRTPDPPGTPTILSLAPSDGQIAVAFAPPTSDGGSPITQYVVTVTGLSNGQTYAFKVNAVSSAGGAGAVSAPTSMLLASSDASLSNLLISSGSLTPTFSSATTTYSASVPSAVTNLQLRPTAGGPGGVIKVRNNGGAFSTVASGQLSPAFSLQLGANAFEVQVTAQNGTTVRTYVVNVTRQTSAMTMSVAPVSAMTGTSGSLMATLASDGIPLANKTVNFTLNGVSVGSAITDSTGRASRPADLTGIAAGDYPAGIGASFDAEGDYGAVSGTGTLHVEEPAINLTLSGVPSTVPFGTSSISVSALLRFGVTPVSGKLIAFALDGVALCGGAGPACKTTNTSGGVTMTVAPLSSLAAGPHLLTAGFSGDVSLPAANAAAPFTVIKPTTYLVVPPVIATAGGTATLRATLRTMSGVALSGETVSFAVNGTSVCGGTSGVVCPVTSSGGVATLSNVSLEGIAPDIYLNGIVAQFEGSSAYEGASSTGALTVDGVSTVLTLASASSPIPGTVMTVTAMLKSGGAALVGKPVRFSFDSAVMCDGPSQPACPLTGTDGKASFNLQLPDSLTPHTVLALFPGDTVNKSAIVTLAVTPNSMPTTLTVLNATAQAGSPLTLKATLKAGTKLLAGKTINFLLLERLFTGVTDAEGVATVLVDSAGLQYGTYAGGITSAFLGDSGYFASSDSATLTISGMPTSLTMVNLNVPVGSSVTLVAKLSAGSSPLAGMPVTFAVGNLLKNAVTDSQGNAVVGLPEAAGFPFGTQTVVVSFAGNLMYKPDSDSATLTLVGVPTTLAMSNVTINAGNPATLVATLKAGAAPLAGQSVSFTVGTYSGSAVTDSLGKATVIVAEAAGFPIGTQTVSASFAGTGIYKPDNKNANLVVK